MSEGGGAETRKNRLAEAVREVKNRAADREDVVLELREASQARLELLAAELAPVFAEVPPEVELFDFAISSGLQPRLWIDAVAHVGLARDRRTFQFVRDTRAGRITVAESASVAPIAEAVTDYIAERIVERERALQGISSSRNAPVPKSQAAETASEPLVPAPSGNNGFLSILVVLGFGVLFGLGLAVAVFWERLLPGLFR